MEVYELLLQADELDICSYRCLPSRSESKQAIRGRADRERKLKYYANTLSTLRERRPLHPAILRTCREVYTEARPVLYRPGKVKLQPCMFALEPTRLHAKHARSLVQIDALSSTSRLDTLHLHVCHSLAAVENTLAHWKGLFMHLNEGLAVRRIIVDVQVFNLQDDLHRLSRVGKDARTSRVLADQFVGFRLLKESLARLRVAEHVEIRYMTNYRISLTWTKKARENGPSSITSLGLPRRVSEKRSAQTHGTRAKVNVQKDFEKKCYGTLIAAAKEIFESRSGSESS